MKEKEFWYVARDKNGELWAFVVEPYKSEVNRVWMSNLWHIKIDSSLYPHVKWEDVEPLRLDEPYTIK